jgi:hypothetical protein
VVHEAAVVLVLGRRFNHEIATAAAADPDERRHEIGLLLLLEARVDWKGLELLQRGLFSFSFAGVV